MPLKVPVLRNLDFFIDEGKAYWLPLDTFTTFLKEKLSPDDLIKVIRKHNIEREIKGFKDGLKPFGTDICISLKSVIRYAINHQDQLKVCRKIADSIEYIITNKDQQWELQSTKELYTKIAKINIRNKAVESHLYENLTIDESDIPSLYECYKAEFSADEWKRILFFEYSFSKQNWDEHTLEDIPFEQLLKRKENFLRDLLSAKNLANNIQNASKTTTTTRFRRMEAAKQHDASRIEAGKYHLPEKLEQQVQKYVQRYGVTSLLALDCTRACHHPPSIHIYGELQTCDISDSKECVEVIQIFLEKYHGTSCSEVIFVKPKTFGKILQDEDEDNIARFKTRDLIVSGQLEKDILFTWKNDDIDEPMKDDENDKCSYCFDASLPKPLHWRSFDIITEWVLDVPVQVQILLESFINPSSVKKPEKLPSLLKKKFTKLYGLYDALLNVSNKNYSGIIQDLNTLELALNYRSVNTVFNITSGFGATRSLNSAEKHIKLQSSEDNCYYNTYLRKFKIQYDTLAGFQIAEKNLRQCFLVLMLDNLVRLTFNQDPDPSTQRSQNICTLPITVKGIPGDAMEVEQWHDPVKCDGSVECQCLKVHKMTNEDIETTLLQLKPDEQKSLDHFKLLMTWGYSDVWSYVTSSETWQSACGMLQSDSKNQTDCELLEQSFASMVLSDDDADEDFSVATNVPDACLAYQDEEGESSENMDLRQLIEHIRDKDIEHLDGGFTYFESLFPPLDTSTDEMNIQTNASEVSSDTALIKQCMESVLSVSELNFEIQESATGYTSSLNPGSLDITGTYCTSHILGSYHDMEESAIADISSERDSPGTTGKYCDALGINILPSEEPDYAWSHKKGSSDLMISVVSNVDCAMDQPGTCSKLKNYTKMDPFNSSVTFANSDQLHDFESLPASETICEHIGHFSNDPNNLNVSTNALLQVNKHSNQIKTVMWDPVDDIADRQKVNPKSNDRQTLLQPFPLYESGEKDDSSVNANKKCEQLYMYKENECNDLISNVQTDTAAENENIQKILPNLESVVHSGERGKYTKTDDTASQVMEYSEQNIALNSSHSQNAQVTVKTKNDSQSTAEASEALGFVQFKPPPSITRHPPPSIGRDDDIVKLREILDDFLLKTDHLHPTDRITNKILFGPDQKIGNNLLKLIKESERYGAFLPEFPCLHLRKSKITNLCTAYKDAGLLHILKYMRDEETQEWSKLISAEDINKASRYIRRLSIAFHLAFVAKFLSTLDEEERLLAEKNMIHGNLFDRRSKYHDRYLMFVKSGVERNATFALHYDIMQHCDEVSAITFAERIGGPDGYNLLLGSVKSSLPFSFMNGAVSYAPYCTQLLIAHYESGPFYQKMKASLFSTPHKTSKCNIGLDCQREMDHQDVIKAFRSGSSESAVLPRMALIDTFNEIQDTPLRNKKVDESDDNLGLELTDTDKKYILRVAALILRQGGLRTHLSTTPFNVYGKHCEQLSESVLDKNTNEIGIFLIQKYLASSKLCGMTKDRLPAITTLAGPKEYIRRVKTAKGHTVKRTTKYLTTKAKSERDIQEEKRQKLVAKQTKTFDCLSSDMNTCQAVVKPDCSKPKVQKSTGIQKALADLVSTCAASAVSDVTALDSSLIYTKATALPVGCRHAKVATLEFAGVKFKAKAISGTTYIGYVNNIILNNIMKMLPNLEHLIICEEKYKFTPDDFKAATRRQREKTDKYTIAHLKTKREMIDTDRFDKESLITTQEGKCLISTHLANNVKSLKIKRDLIMDIDSEYYIQDCTCTSADCNCNIFATPLRCTFTKDGLAKTEALENICQRKGEAELSQIDWLVSQGQNVHGNEPYISFVTSGDIDSVVVHIFAISHLWPRSADGTFLNQVYVILQKPYGQIDVYNITGLVALLEEFYGERFIGLKVSVGLSLGGNDYLPRFYGISHTKTVSLLMSSSKFRETLIEVHCDEDCKFQKLEFNPQVYVDFVKHLYCPESLDANILSFDEVRQLSVQPMKFAGSEEVRTPQSWMPPAQALKKLSQNVDCLIKYYMTVGYHEASLPDFLRSGCLKRLSNGEIEYDLGNDTKIENVRLLLNISPKQLRLRVKMSRNSKVGGRKRKIAETSQKGRRRKLKSPLLTSTPTK